MSEIRSADGAKKEAAFFAYGIVLLALSVLFLFHLDYEMKFVCLKSADACAFSNNKALSRDFKGYDGFKVSEIAAVKPHIYTTEHTQKGRKVRRTHYEIEISTREPAKYYLKNFGNHRAMWGEINKFKQFCKNPTQERYERNRDQHYVFYVGLVFFALSVFCFGAFYRLRNKP